MIFITEKENGHGKALIQTGFITTEVGFTYDAEGHITNFRTAPNTIISDDIKERIENKLND